MAKSTLLSEEDLAVAVSIDKRTRKLTWHGTIKEVKKDGWRGERGNDGQKKATKVIPISISFSLK